MNNKFLLVILFLGIFNSCERIIKPTFKEFIFINFNRNSSISIKFNGSDTIYKQEQISGEEQQNSYSLLNKTQRDSLINFINAINESKIETKKYKPYFDDKDLQFLIIKNEGYRLFTNYNNDAPKQINDITIFLKKYNSSKNFIVSYEKKDFWGKFPSPPLPPPKVNVQFNNITATNSR